ncbi:hypothetical protein CVT25_005351 [Psilocybe cyanescens]|uniref:Uncharacterized protein n=1 Tax=Psilocybe cyanescens TaxID=93625 RepID=A0A409VW16_PSICY|nr:hypothetical protein CVT25_005351 [Psilocybe cyanescens]
MFRSASSDSPTGSPAPSSVSGSSSTDGTSRTTPGKAKAVKPPNVFSNDGSFLDRIRRSIKEEEDKKKEKDALERKKQFADRFKTRGKRPAPSVSPPSTSDVTTPESDESPRKKLKVEENNKDDGSAQCSSHHLAEYHKAMESYPGSLKDGGNGVRPLIKQANNTESIQ